MLVLALVANGLPKHKIPLTKSGKPYQTKGHARHPVTLWTGRTSGNFNWHLRYAISMMGEYTYRNGKTRAGFDVLRCAVDYQGLVPKGPLEQFQNSSMYQEITDTDVPECYRQTMVSKWLADKIKVKWTKRKPPDWCTVPVVKMGEIYYRFTVQESLDVEASLLG